MFASSKTDSMYLILNLWCIIRLHFQSWEHYLSYVDDSEKDNKKRINFHSLNYEERKKYIASYKMPQAKYIGNRFFISDIVKNKLRKILAVIFYPEEELEIRKIALDKLSNDWEISLLLNYLDEINYEEEGLSFVVDNISGDKTNMILFILYHLGEKMRRDKKTMTQGREVIIRLVEKLPASEIAKIPIEGFSGMYSSKRRYAEIVQEQLISKMEDEQLVKLEQYGNFFASIRRGSNDNLSQILKKLHPELLEGSVTAFNQIKLILEKLDQDNLFRAFELLLTTGDKYEWFEFVIDDKNRVFGLRISSMMRSDYRVNWSHVFDLLEFVSTRYKNTQLLLDKIFELKSPAAFPKNYIIKRILDATGANRELIFYVINKSLKQVNYSNILSYFPLYNGDDFMRLYQQLTDENHQLSFLSSLTRFNSYGNVKSLKKDDFDQVTSAIYDFLYRILCRDELKSNVRIIDHSIEILSEFQDRTRISKILHVYIISNQNKEKQELDKTFLHALQYLELSDLVDILKQTKRDNLGIEAFSKAVTNHQRNLSKTEGSTDGSISIENEYKLLDFGLSLYSKDLADGIREFIVRKYSIHVSDRRKQEVIHQFKIRVFRIDPSEKIRKDCLSQISDTRILIDAVLDETQDVSVIALERLKTVLDDSRNAGNFDKYVVFEEMARQDLPIVVKNKVYQILSSYRPLYVPSSPFQDFICQELLIILNTGDNTENPAISNTVSLVLNKGLIIDHEVFVRFIIECTNEMYKKQFFDKFLQQNPEINYLRALVPNIDNQNMQIRINNKILDTLIENVSLVYPIEDTNPYLAAHGFDKSYVLREKIAYFEKKNGQPNNYSYSQFKEILLYYHELLGLGKSLDKGLVVMRLYNQILNKIALDPVGLGLSFKQNKDLIEVHETFQKLIQRNFDKINTSDILIIIQGFNGFYSQKSFIFRFDIEWLNILSTIIINLGGVYPNTIIQAANSFVTSVLNHPEFDLNSAIKENTGDLLVQVFEKNIETIIILSEVAPMQIAIPAMTISIISQKIKNLQMVKAVQEIVPKLSSIPFNIGYPIWSAIQNLCDLDDGLKMSFLTFLNLVATSGDQMANSAQHMISGIQGQSPALVSSSVSISMENGKAEVFQRCPNCQEFQSLLTRTCVNCNAQLEFCQICKAGFSVTQKPVFCMHCKNAYHKSHLYAYVQSKGQCAICNKPLTIADVEVQ